MTKYFYELDTTRGKITGFMEAPSLKALCYRAKLMYITRASLKNYKENIIIER